MSTSDYKLQEGLAPAHITLDGMPVERPCVFRRGGLCIIAFHEPGGTVYGVVHEDSGLFIGPGTTNQWRALSTVAALLSRGVDWTRTKEEVFAQVQAADELTRTLVAAIQAGTVRFQEMGSA